MLKDSDLRLKSCTIQLLHQPIQSSSIALLLAAPVRRGEESGTQELKLAQEPKNSSSYNIAEDWQDAKCHDNTYQEAERCV